MHVSIFVETSNKCNVQWLHDASWKMHHQASLDSNTTVKNKPVSLAKIVVKGVVTIIPIASESAALIALSGEYFYQTLWVELSLQDYGKGGIFTLV